MAKLQELLAMIANIERDDDGDAMLDGEGLDRLQELAREVSKDAAV